jgi:hypothetical protein
MPCQLKKGHKSDIDTYHAIMTHHCFNELAENTCFYPLLLLGDNVNDGNK